MNNVRLYLKASSSIFYTLKFMLATYDGKFVIIVSLLYFVWGVIGVFGVTHVDNVEPLGLIAIAVALLVVFIWHRIDSYSDDIVKSIFCLIGTTAIAVIPFHKFIEELI